MEAVANESLPTGWTNGVLKEFIERPEYGYTDSASDDPSGMKFLRITDIQDGRVNWPTVPYCDCPPDVLAAKRLLPGDVVVARIGATTGKSFYIDAPPEDAVFASYLIRLRVKPAKMMPRFLYYYMQSANYWGHIDLHKGARLRGGVNIAVLESLPVIVPPLSEQARIVSVLDVLQLAVHSEAARATHAAALQKSAISELFARGLRGESQKETSLGAMPGNWSPRTIKDLCDIWSGGTPRKSKPAYWNGDVPWVSGKDLKSASLDDATDHISDQGLEAGSRLAPEDAVLLLVRGMGLANDLPVAVITRPMAFNQDVKALVLREEVPGRFLRAAIYAARERLLGRVTRSAHGTMTLNLNDVETLEIAWPANPDEADEIVVILEAIETKLRLHQRKRDVYENLLDALVNELLTGRILTDELDLSALPGSGEPTVGAEGTVE